MNLLIPAALCSHPDSHLKLAVDNRGAATKATVYCALCASSWRPETLTGELLDRCVQLFERAR